MAESTRASRLAIRKETNEGTLLDISAGSQYIPLRPGFEFTPNLENIQNEEIRSSIGRAAPIPGIENPTASFQEYLKHSGVEGQAPNWGPLLESLFGLATTNATQRSTTSSSTVSLIKAASNGSEFPRGTPMLIKDGTNGYSIRFSDGYATNDITPNFDLANAPASGIGLGKAVYYTPQDSGHPTLSLWLLRGNGGAKEAIAGARVTEMTMNVVVGEPIDLDFSLEGVSYYFNPIRIDSTNNKLDITTDNVTDDAATIPSKVYKNPHELARAIKAALETADPLETFTVTFSNSTGKFTITSSSTVLSLLWKTGANGSDNTGFTIGSTIGFSEAADNTGTAGSTGYTSDNAQAYTDAQTPSFDSADLLVAKNMEVLIGGSASDYESVCLTSLTAQVTNVRQALNCINAESGVGGSVFGERNCELQMVLTLNRHDAGKFDKFINGSDVKFQFTFGTKSGGNWVAGKCGGLYVPTGKYSAFQVSDQDGIVTMNLSIQPYVNSSGQPEIYMGFV